MGRGGLDYSMLGLFHSVIDSWCDYFPGVIIFWLI
jgi:hypothetical protein